VKPHTLNRLFFPHYKWTPLSPTPSPLRISSQAGDVPPYGFLRFPVPTWRLLTVHPVFSELEMAPLCLRVAGSGMPDGWTWRRRVFLFLSLQVGFPCLTSRPFLSRHVQTRFSFFPEPRLDPPHPSVVPSSDTLRVLSKFFFFDQAEARCPFAIEYLRHSFFQFQTFFFVIISCFSPFSPPNFFDWDYHTPPVS